MTFVFYDNGVIYLVISEKQQLLILDNDITRDLERTSNI